MATVKPNTIPTMIEVTGSKKNNMVYCTTIVEGNSFSWSIEIIIDYLDLKNQIYNRMNVVILPTEYMARPGILSGAFFYSDMFSSVSSLSRAYDLLYPDLS